MTASGVDELDAILDEFQAEEIQHEDTQADQQQTLGAIGDTGDDYAAMLNQHVGEDQSGENQQDTEADRKRDARAMRFGTYVPGGGRKKRGRGAMMDLDEPLERTDDAQELADVDFKPGFKPRKPRFPQRKNKHPGGIVGGFDMMDVDAIQQREKRAARFGQVEVSEASGRQRSFLDQDAMFVENKDKIGSRRARFGDAVISKSRSDDDLMESIRCGELKLDPSVDRRFDAIHVRISGKTFHIDNAHLKRVFADFDTWFEWIDDNRLNVVFPSPDQASLALASLSVEIPSQVPSILERHPDADAKLVRKVAWRVASDVSTANTANRNNGRGQRRGGSNRSDGRGQATIAMLMRFATADDKKIPRHLRTQGSKWEKIKGKDASKKRKRSEARGSGKSAMFGDALDDLSDDGEIRTAKHKWQSSDDENDQDNEVVTSKRRGGGSSSSSQWVKDSEGNLVRKGPKPQRKAPVKKASRKKAPQRAESASEEESDGYDSQYDSESESGEESGSDSGYDSGSSDAGSYDSESSEDERPAKRSRHTRNVVQRGRPQGHRSEHGRRSRSSDDEDDVEY